MTEHWQLHQTATHYILLVFTSQCSVKDVFSWSKTSPIGSIYYSQISTITPQGLLFCNIGDNQALCKPTTNTPPLNVGSKVVVQLSRAATSTAYEHKLPQVQTGLILQSPLLVIKPHAAFEIQYSRKLGANTIELLNDALTTIQHKYGNMGVGASIMLRTAIDSLIPLPKALDFISNHISDMLKRYSDQVEQCSRYTQGKTPAKAGLIQAIPLNMLIADAQLHWLLRQVRLLPADARLTSTLLADTLTTHAIASPLLPIDFSNTVVNPPSIALSLNYLRTFTAIQHVLPCGAQCIIEHTHVGLVVDVNSQTSVDSHLVINEQAIAHLAAYIYFNGVYGNIIVDIVALSNKQRSQIIDYTIHCFAQFGMAVHPHISPLEILELAVAYPQHKALSVAQCITQLQIATPCALINLPVSASASV